MSVVWGARRRARTPGCLLGVVILLRCVDAVAWGVNQSFEAASKCAERMMLKPTTGRPRARTAKTEEEAAQRQ